MITFEAVHEKQLTAFHQNHFIITIADLKEENILLNSEKFMENYFPVETFKRIFPLAPNEKISAVLISTIQLKISEGHRAFLIVYTDGSESEAKDMAEHFIFFFRTED